MTAQDLVLIIGAYSFFVLGAFGLLTKFVLDTRKTSSETNRAVNDRPHNEPTIRELVESVDVEIRELRYERRQERIVAERRHKENTERLDCITDRLDKNTDRLDAVEDNLKTHMADVATETKAAGFDRDLHRDDRKT